MIRIKSLTIQAFRGVPKLLELDLSAPLVVIYAPNGTGKTTVCDAIEWLLTGSIKRLNSIDGVRCQFSEEQTPTAVTGEMEVYGERILLERTLNAWRWKQGDAPFRAVKSGDLLEKLAPSAVEEGVHRTHANVSRQIWLRGTRFLSGEALSTLLDSDSASITGRERLFADLLGVGHLLETERQLEAYQAEIDKTQRVQQERVSLKEAAIREIESKSADLGGLDRESMLGSAWQYLLGAEELIGTEQSKRFEATITIAAAIGLSSALRVELDGDRAQWNERRRAELLLVPDWAQRLTLPEIIDNDRVQVSALEKQLLGYAEALSATRIKQEENKDYLMALRARLNLLAGLHRDVIACDLDLRGLSDIGYAGSIESSWTILDAAKLVREVGDEAYRRSTLSTLRQLVQDTSDFGIKGAELEISERSAVEAQSLAVTPEALQTFMDERSTASEEVASLRTRYVEMAGTIDQLRRLALDVVKRLEHETDCPVCSHNWGDTLALRRALEETAALTDKRLSDLQEQLNSALARESDVNARLENANNEISRATAALRRLNLLRTARAELLQRLSSAGVEPIADNPTALLNSRIRSLELVPIFQRMLAATDLAQKTIEFVVPRDLSVFEFAAALVPAILERHASGVAQIEAAESKAEQWLLESDNLTKMEKRAMSESDALRKRLQQSADRYQSLQAAWQLLAGERFWSDEELSRASGALRLHYDVQQRAERQLDQADALLRDLASVDELEQLRDELKPLVGEWNRITSYSEAALAVRSSYEQFRMEHVRQQMADFVRVISGLFVRLQANLVFEDIILGEADQPLSWKALADKVLLDPEATFSQGQRQDFALSIFLARARGLGGAFILDEPVTHLDDLNRVALLDVFRAITLERTPGLSFVITSANKSFVRHLVEKFALTKSSGENPGTFMRIIELDGNPRAGVTFASNSESTLN